MKARQSSSGSDGGPSGQYQLRLYVAGSSSRSMQAIANIKIICEQHLKERYQLEVIDLYQQPERAKGEQIVALPTLIKELPLPVRRIIGDLSDTKLVCANLDITPEIKNSLNDGL